jgi:uncharacterized protein (TIGR00288 family)
MNQMSPAAPDLTLTRCRAVALLVDGDQFPVSLAGRAILAARQLGMLAVLRIYGNSDLSDGWRNLGYHPIKVDAGKNVTDMTLTVATMELSYAGAVDGFMIATRDRDFLPLVRSLRERGFPVWGLSQAPMPVHLQAAFTNHVCLQPATRDGAAASATGSKVTLSPGQGAAPVLIPAPAAKPAPVAKPAAATQPKPASKPGPRAIDLISLEAAIRGALAAGPASPKDFGAQMTHQKLSVPKPNARWQSWLRANAPYVSITGSGLKTRFALKP